MHLTWFYSEFANNMVKLLQNFLGLFAMHHFKLFALFIAFSIATFLGCAQAESFNLETESGEEVTVHDYPATFADAKKTFANLVYRRLCGTQIL
ncbi:hypothetical protein THIOSC13_900008 [uncultured Thiomicrorhabdus sp.]